MKICICVGTRPNFIKAAPLIRALEKQEMLYHLVHTGQHYDKNISDIFFQELCIPAPHINLSAGLENSIEQTAQIMQSFQLYCAEYKPDIIIVFGDALSSLACALTAQMMKIKLVHIEAGERSFDRTMPEEINRILIDQISDYLFCTSPSRISNLASEGITKSKIYHVGNIMIDNLLYYLPKIIRQRRSCNSPYAILTLHRQSNVDNKRTLKHIMRDILIPISKKIPVKFPIHPRTRKKLIDFGLMAKLSEYYPGIIILEPLGYLDFLGLVYNAEFVMTDSGGLQCETTILSKPCLTLRNNTEWVETVSRGTNFVVGLNEELIFSAVNEILAGKWQKKNQSIDKWDGKTADRIIKILANSNV
jgi:UDP-N-acetylglucosamine 2-epimerase (non-hydrolysing)